MANHKTDTNNYDGFSIDFIGQNYDYPKAPMLRVGKSSPATLSINKV
ncbi:MAG: hypothetical protein ABI600_17540 [Luteolibacter sp.]